MATDARTIIAVTGEDDRYERSRAAAIERAREAHATLILYDIDAGANILDSPLPTDWSAEGTDDQAADRLGPDELEAAGRATVARQVREARSAGVDAWGWLPSDPGRDALLEYANGQPDALLVVPDAEEELADVDPAEVLVVPAEEKGSDLARSV